MTEDRSPSTETQLMPPATPDPALKRFERLIGKWHMTGRTLDAEKDNIFGWNTFEWLPGGFFLLSRGETDFNGFAMQSLEIIGYDPERGTFRASVYSSMAGDVFSYEWDVQGNTLIHAGLGATYTGTFSEDGNTILGGWRSDEGTPMTDGTAYDATMTRVL